MACGCGGEPGGGVVSVSRSDGGRAGRLGSVAGELEPHGEYRLAAGDPRQRLVVPGAVPRTDLCDDRGAPRE